MIDGKKILAIIPCRRGSKAIIGKNFMPLCGKPLFSWSVDASLASEYIDWTLISSNCPMIQRETLRLYPNRDRLRFVQRPDEISGDFSPSEEALEHGVEFAEKVLNFQCNYVVMLQPTSPLRPDRLIDKCIEQIIDEHADSLMTVSTHTPFFVKKETSGQLKWFYDYKNRPMRQQLSENDMFFHDDGSIYLVKRKILLSEKCRLWGTISLYINDPKSSLQIDTLDDFVILENIMKLKYSRTGLE